MNKPKVYLTGGDGIGWAVDEDLRLIRRAIEDIVDLVDLQSCEIVHSAWWYSLLELPFGTVVRQTYNLSCTW